MVAGGWAGAQEALVFKGYNGSITIQNCFKSDARTAVCNGSLISNDDRALKFDGGVFRLVDSVGNETKLSGFIFKGANQIGKDIQAVKAFKYSIQLIFSVYTPSTVKFMDSNSYDFGTIRYENVALATSASKSAAVAVAPTPASGAAINLGTTQAVLGGKAYNLTLNNCKSNAAGMYTCAITTATPAR